MDLDLEAEVRTADGRMNGLVSGVVIDPERRVVTHVVVARYGVVVAVERVVPITDVAGVEDHRLRLNLSVSELDGMPQLEERAYVSLEGIGTGSEERPAVSARGIWQRTPALALPPLISEHTSDQANVEEVWRNVPAGSLVLRDGMAVREQSGRRVGRLREVALDPDTGKLMGIVISRGGRLRVVPAGWIERSDEETGIVLAVDRHAVADLPSDD